MNEHGFIKAINRHVHPDIHTWKIHDSFCGGIPDSWYAGRNSKHLFVEYKYKRAFPARDSTTISFGLSQLQLNWLYEMYQRGIPTMLMVGVEKSVATFVGHELPAIMKVAVTKSEFKKMAVDFKTAAAIINSAVGF